MLIYEVNLTVEDEIYDDYFAWLVPHVKEILQFRGFTKAEISEDKTVENESGQRKLIVHYTVSSDEDLHDYFVNHAAKMRAGAVEKFGNKFSATRRMYQSLIIL
jgi:hypothetical protein